MLDVLFLILNAFSLGIVFTTKLIDIDKTKKITFSGKEITWLTLVILLCIMELHDVAIAMSCFGR